MTQARRRGARPGNRNAVKLHRGLRTSVYLSAADIAALDEELARQSTPASDAARRALARDLLTLALRALRDRQDEPPIIV